MRPHYRTGIIVACCITVIAITAGLIYLLNPRVADFASGPYTPLFAFITGGGNPSSALYLGSAADAPNTSLGAYDSLFDDPTSALPPSATPTAFIAAAGAPFANTVNLLVEPTVRSEANQLSTTPTGPIGGEVSPSAASNFAPTARSQAQTSPVANIPTRTSRSIVTPTSMPTAAISTPTYTPKPPAGPAKPPTSTPKSPASTPKPPAKPPKPPASTPKPPKPPKPTAAPKHPSPPTPKAPRSTPCTNPAGKPKPCKK